MQSYNSHTPFRVRSIMQALYSQSQLQQDDMETHNFNSNATEVRPGCTGRLLVRSAPPPDRFILTPITTTPSSCWVCPDIFATTLQPLYPPLWEESVHIEIAPPLVTPETIQHATQALEPYPVYRSSTVYPGTDGEVPETFQSRMIQYVIVPSWRFDIMREWLEKHKLSIPTLQHDADQVLYEAGEANCYAAKGRRMCCRVLQGFLAVSKGPKAFDFEAFIRWGKPTQSKTREVLQYIKSEREAESKGIWKREDWRNLWEEGGPFGFYGPNNW